MDEAHYFLADSAFNSDVYNCISAIKARKDSHVLFFMTATPEYLLIGLGQCGLLPLKPPTFWFESSYHYIPIHYQCKNFFSESSLLFQLSSPKNLLKYKEATDSEIKNMRIA